MTIPKTIKPDGSGDYTTLQAWYNYAKLQSNADQWAECYTGNLGGIILKESEWTSTPDENNYPRIYAADGHQHQGIDSENCAYIEISMSEDNNPAISNGEMNFSGNMNGVSYLRIEGLLIKAPGGIHIINSNYACIDNNFIIATDFYTNNGLNKETVSAINLSTAHIEDVSEIITNALIKNNLCIGLLMIASSGYNAGVCTLNAVVYNNTINSAIFLQSDGKGGESDTGTYVVNIVLVNNIANTYYLIGSENIITTGSQNNFSSDDTANTFIGGTGNIVNMPMISELIDPSVNLNKIYGNITHGAGVYLASVTTDYIGNPRNNPPDMGADEYTTYKWKISPQLTIKPKTEFL